MIITGKVVILALFFGLAMTAESQKSVKRSHRRIRNLQKHQDHATLDILPPLSPLDDVARERELKAGKFNDNGYGCDELVQGNKNYLFSGPCDLGNNNGYFDQMGNKGQGMGNFKGNNGQNGFWDNGNQYSKGNFNQMWPNDKKGKNGQNGFWGNGNQYSKGNFNQLWPNDKKGNKKGFWDGNQYGKYGGYPNNYPGASQSSLFGYNPQSLYSSGSTIIPSKSLQMAISLSTLGVAVIYFLI